MLKTVCDICGREAKESHVFGDSVVFRTKTKCSGKTVMLEVTPYLAGKIRFGRHRWKNRFDVCRKCVKKMIAAVKV